MKITELKGINPVLSGVDTDEKISHKKKEKTSNNKSVEVKVHSMKENLTMQLSGKKPPKTKSIQSIKESARSGTYEINYEKIAAKIMELDKLWYE